MVKNPAGTGPLTGVESVEAGVYWSCAVLTTGQARCWGFDLNQSLGNGATNGTEVPGPVLIP